MTGQLGFGDRVIFDKGAVRCSGKIIGVNTTAKGRRLFVQISTGAGHVTAEENLRRVRKTREQSNQ